MTLNERGKLADQLLLSLMELFDSVQVMGSFVNPATGKTELYSCGHGNFYARIGMAQEFLDTGQAETISIELARELVSRKNDDGEGWKRDE